MDPKRYSVYYTPGSGIQLRDQEQASDGFANAGIVAVFPTLGGRHSTSQTPTQALRRARKIARLLNGLR